jgi:hypothetical protein
MRLRVWREQKCKESLHHDWLALDATPCRRRPPRLNFVGAEFGFRNRAHFLNSIVQLVGQILAVDPPPLSALRPNR